MTATGTATDAAQRAPLDLERGWPYALEQVPERLHAGHVLLEQLLPAGPEVAQPSPRRVGLVDRLRQVAAQLPGQPGDEHASLS